jgi:hypothetical protein
MGDGTIAGPAGTQAVNPATKAADPRVFPTHPRASRRYPTYFVFSTQQGCIRRKGFGCRCAVKVPAQLLQKLLMRHSDIRITMDYYANIGALEVAVLGVGRNGGPVPELNRDADGDANS